MIVGEGQRENLRLHAKQESDTGLDPTIVRSLPEPNSRI